MLPCGTNSTAFNSFFKIPLFRKFSLTFNENKLLAVQAPPSCSPHTIPFAQLSLNVPCTLLPATCSGYNEKYHIDTYLLTAYSTALLEKLIGFQLVKKFPAFYGTQMFITAFTSARHLSLSCASSTQSIPPIPLPEDQS